MTTLTAQERRIAELIKSGMSAKRIAAELDISWRTVEYHRDSIRRKYGARSSLELVCLLLRGEGGEPANGDKANG